MPHLTYAFMILCRYDVDFEMATALDIDNNGIK